MWGKGGCTGSFGWVLGFVDNFCCFRNVKTFLAMATSDGKRKLNKKAKRQAEKQQWGRVTVIYPIDDTKWEAIDVIHSLSNVRGHWDLGAAVLTEKGWPMKNVEAI